MDSPDIPTASPVNHRITWLILVFVAMSLAASALPIVSGIQDVVPLGVLSHRFGMMCYACFLLGFMAFVLPAVVRRPESPDSVTPWFWVGSFILGFAGVPLFVLAYIAGVHRDGVLLTLTWAGICHGVVLLLLRWFRYRGRAVVVVLGFFATVLVPALGALREMLLGTSPWPSPIGAVLDVTRDLAPVHLVGPIAMLAVVYGVVLFGPKLRPRRAAAAATVVLLGLIVAGAAPPSGRDVEVVWAAGGWVVPGRPVALRLEAGPATPPVEVDVAGRETYRWVPGPAGDQTWLYVVVASELDRIEVRVGSDSVASEASLRVLPGDRRLALQIRADRLPLWPEADVAGRALEVTSLAPDIAPRSVLGLRAFSVVGVTAAVFAADESLRRALESFAADGGTLLLVDAEGGERSERFGRGTIRRSAERTLPADLDLPDRSLESDGKSLYSHFGLPDWSRVDLSGLLVFLFVYHAVFYLIFLLPLLLDSRKSMTVYLVSVGFVVVLEIGGGWYALKQIFLRENQTLEQTVTVYEVPDATSARPQLLIEQVSCFASFNNQPVRLGLARAVEPWIEHENDRQGAGLVRVDDRALVLPEIPLDRFRRKQIIHFGARLESPLRVADGGERIRFLPIAGVEDRLGLGTARRLAAFVRRDGHLYRAAVEGSEFRVAPTPEPTAWRGVVPEEFRDENDIPFLRYVLGRFAPPGRPVLVVLLRGAGLLHDDPGYLAHRDIVQVLLVPLGPD